MIHLRIYSHIIIYSIYLHIELFIILHTVTHPPSPLKPKTNCQPPPNPPRKTPKQQQTKILKLSINLENRIGL